MNDSKELYGWNILCDLYRDRVQQDFDDTIRLHDRLIEMRNDNLKLLEQLARTQKNNSKVSVKLSQLKLKLDNLEKKHYPSAGAKQ